MFHKHTLIFLSVVSCLVKVSCTSCIDLINRNSLQVTQCLSSFVFLINRIMCNRIEQ